MVDDKVVSYYLPSLLLPHEEAHPAVGGIFQEPRIAQSPLFPFTIFPTVELGALAVQLLLALLTRFDFADDLQCNGRRPSGNGCNLLFLHQLTLLVVPTLAGL